jgi:ATP/ADP translocase
MSIVRLFLGRWIAGLIAAFVAWAATKGIDITADTQKDLVEKIVAMALAIFGILYPFLHKLLDRWINPGDAASAHLAEKEGAEVARLRSGLEAVPSTTPPSTKRYP